MWSEAYARFVEENFPSKPLLITEVRFVVAGVGLDCSKAFREKRHSGAMCSDRLGQAVFSDITDLRRRSGLKNFRALRPLRARFRFSLIVGQPCIVIPHSFDIR